MSKQNQINEMQSTMARYEQLQADLDKKVQLKDFHDQDDVLQIELSSRKGMHWMNTEEGKAPLVLQSMKGKIMAADEKQKKKRSNSSGSISFT